MYLERNIKGQDRSSSYFSEYSSTGIASSYLWLCDLSACPLVSLTTQSAVAGSAENTELSHCRILCWGMWTACRCVTSQQCLHPSCSKEVLNILLQFKISSTRISQYLLGFVFVLACSLASVPFGEATVVMWNSGQIGLVSSLAIFGIYLHGVWSFVSRVHDQEVEFTSQNN